MQNWYSQNNPFKSNGVGEGYGVEIGFEVGVEIADKVATTAWLIWAFGSGVGVLRPQAVTMNKEMRSKER